MFRDCWFCPIAEQVAISALTNCNKPRHFWASWQNNTITIGAGTTRNLTPLMIHRIEGGYQINYVGLNTANNATGTWIFPLRMHDLFLF